MNKHQIFQRTLSWIQYVYLGTIPLIGAFAIVLRGHAWTPLIILGWIPVVVYLALHGAHYRLVKNPFRAALSVLVVPLFTLASTIYFSENLWFYLLQEAAIELSVMLLGIMIAMVIARPTGWFGTFVVAILGIPSLLVFLIPLVNEFQKLPFVSWIFLGAIFASGIIIRSSLFVQLATTFNRTGVPQKPNWTFGGGGPSVSPVHNTDRAAIIWITITLLSWVFLGAFSLTFFPA